MPPYENESLHDMHALMQQLDTLNAAHAPEHLEMFGMSKKDDKTTPAPAKDPKPGMLTRVIGSITGKTAAPAALTEKDLTWKGLDATERLTVFKNTFKDIAASIQLDDYNNLKQVLESNPKTNEVFQANIINKPQLK